MMKKNAIPVVAAVFAVFILTAVLAEARSIGSVLKAPVIQFRYRAIQDFGRTTGISIYDYGRVYVYGAHIKGKGRYLPYPEKEVRELLDYIVNRQDFFSITDSDVRKFSRNREKVCDAPTTVIRVWCPKGTHKISVYNFESGTPVRSAAMIRLRRIVRRLEKLRRKMAGKVR